MTHKSGLRSAAFAVVILSLVANVPGTLSQSQVREKASAEKSIFGRMEDGTAIKLFTLKNAKGTRATIIEYGATLQGLWVPDKTGKFRDVVLGFDGLQGYLGQHPYFGGTIGRVANRIAKGKFVLDGKEFSMALNNSPNSLYGGKEGFNRKIWKGNIVKRPHAVSVRLTHISPDGEEGFPGALKVTVTYTLTDENELKIDYTASSDKATPVNLTSHSYFNLTGSGSILDHSLYLNADKYTPVDSTLIPTGEIVTVKGTPFDFTQATSIGARISQLTGDPGGYDHNLVLNGWNGKLKLAARLSDPASGRQMEMWTTEPGVQFYSGNFLDGTIKGKQGAVYQKHAALCLEAQHFPDSVNHTSFPTTILRPGSIYKQETVYKFLVN